MGEDGVKAHSFFGADKAAGSPPALVSAYAMDEGLWFCPALECRMRFEDFFSLKRSRAF